MLVVDDGKGGEAVARAELAAPARGDGVVAKVLGAAVALGGGGAPGVPDDKVDGRLGVDLGVDGKLPVALGVVLVAPAVGALDGPLGDALGQHGLFGRGGSRSHGGGGEEGGHDGLGELHVGGGGKFASRLCKWMDGLGWDETRVSRWMLRSEWQEDSWNLGQQGALYNFSRFAQSPGLVASCSCRHGGRDSSSG